MISKENLVITLSGLLEVLPMLRPLSAPALAFVWDTFPQVAKEQLTPASLEWACGQRLLDPNPPKDVAIHHALLRYVYPLENNRAAWHHGLRHDLAKRMAEPDRFFDPTDVQPKNLPVVDASMRLTSGGNNLRSFQAAVEAVIAHGSSVEFGHEQIWIGRVEFERLLSKKIPPDPEDFRNCANGWILRNPDKARGMVRAAMACEQLPEEPKQLASADGGLGDFVGTWPGDESDAELIDALRGIR
jgi:hypothetical protein